MIYIAAVCYMVLPTEVLTFVDRMIYGEWPGKPGDKFTQLLNLLAIALSLLLFWLGTRGRTSQVNRVIPLVAAGLFAISVLWSISPSTTMTRSIAYFFLVLGAIGIAEIFDPDEVMRLTALIGGVSAALSLVLPDAAYAIAGDFRGPFPGKNQLGAAMVIGVLGGLHSIRVARRRRFIYIGTILLCTIVAFLSKSGTSLVTILALFIFNLIGRFYIRGGIRRILSMFAALLVTGSFIVLMLNMGLVYSVLDKDPTLTGRTDFWPNIIDSIYQRPLLGWGFTAFWTVANPAAVEIASNIGLFINEAHNGLLQLLLDVGIVGTAFFLFLWLRNVVLAVKCINGPAPAIGVSSLALLIGILLMGVTEQVLTTVDVWTAQFFMMGFMCEKQLGLAERARSAIALRPAALRLGQLAGSREGDAV
jgi:O-antigen ligase